MSKQIIFELSKIRLDLDHIVDDVLNGDDDKALETTDEILKKAVKLRKQLKRRKIK